MQRPSAQYIGLSESLRPLSLSNPFRKHTTSSLVREPPRPTYHRNGLSHLVRSNGSNFEEWVRKNRDLLASSDEDDLNLDTAYLNEASASALYDDESKFQLSARNQTKPQPPFLPKQPVRAGSDSSVSYSDRRMSNNPFAFALDEPVQSGTSSQSHHNRDRDRERERERDRETSHESSRLSREHRQDHTLSKESRKAPPRPRKDVLAPPAYDDVTGSRSKLGEYPREKHHSSSEHRLRSSRTRSHSDTPKPSSKHLSKSKLLKKKVSPEVLKSKNLDTIDKLDVTAFFGGGFHHDGPFDACTPHRNKNSKVAPVKAYAIDGPNNCIKGLSGAPDQSEQMNLAFGKYYDDDAHGIATISPSKIQHPLQANPALSESYPSIINFDSQRLAQPIHGPATAGLGSTTFVDGGPAPRAAQDDMLSPSRTMSRKKLLVHRLRKNSGSNSAGTPAEPQYSSLRRSSHDPPSFANRRRSSDNSDDFIEERTGNSLLSRVKSLKVGRR